MTLVYLAAAWLAGIAVGQAARTTWWLWLIPALLSLIGLVTARHHARWRMGFGCGLACMLGAARLSAAVPHFDENDLATYNDQGVVTIEGLVIDAPDVRDTHINLRVRAETIQRDGGPAQPVEGWVLIQTPRTAAYRYGDPVRARGELHTPPELDTFSYRDFLAREGVYSILQYAQVEIAGPRRGNPIRAALLDFREHTHQTIVRLLPNPQASLLSGILLGIESDISPDVKAAFNAVGATHVIVISGTNLVILAGLFQSLARRIVKKSVWVVATTIAGIVAYAIFVGGDAAVIRAAIMTTLALVAAEVGRETYGLASLSFAALLMTLINPLWLWDVGFQLSLLATLGLILYVEPLQRLLARGLSKLLAGETAQGIVGGISDAFVVTLAAQITTTPLIAYTFGRLPLLSLPVNFLIVPAQPPLMVLGGLGVLAALAIWPVGQGLAWASWLFLTWTIEVVQVFAQLPAASVEVRVLSPWALGGIYAMVFGVTLYAVQPESDRIRQRAWLRQALSVKLLGAVGLIMAALLIVGMTALPDGRLHVTFIDVGDGTATLIETPSGRQILVDAGGSGRKLAAGLGDGLPFWDRRIDVLVLSQPTSAHVSGLLTLLGRYRFDAVMTVGEGSTPQTTEVVWSILNEQGAPQVVAQPGMHVVVGDGVTLTVLHVPSTMPADTEESGEPIVLLVVYGNARILLPGDLSAEGEEMLLNSHRSIDATVLAVSRGGHRDSSSEAFLAVVDPQVAVISVGTGNRHGLPHAEALARLRAAGADVYRTDQHGTIEVITDGQRMWIETKQ